MNNDQEITCINCVSDTVADPEIVFDTDGVCNYCHESYIKLKLIEQNKPHFHELIEKIKKTGEGREYDCLIGMSGGVDSSYVAHLASVHKLRPLIVHFDNGWNSELAVDNIKKIIDKHNYDLHTLVVNWNEFKDIQKSLFKASVVDIEIVTDHAITATMVKLAKSKGIKYVLSGSNDATESGMPPSWSWRKQDWMNIKAIHKIFGQEKIRTFPHYSSFQMLFDRLLSTGYKSIPILDYIDFKKNEAICILEKEYGWRQYGGKHYESIFTKFYQAYVLPEKFKIDKRKSHLSALIRNGEITRDEAITELRVPLYDENELSNDMDFVCKKLGFSKSELNEIMKLDIKAHDFYPSDQKYYDLLSKINKKLKIKKIMRRVVPV